VGSGVQDAMRRKECDKSVDGQRRAWAGCRAGALLLSLMFLVVVVGSSRAGECDCGVVSVRLWGRAAVESERILLGDVAQVAGGSAADRARIEAVVVGASPQAGGSFGLKIDDLDGRLRLAGVNPAEVLVGGATVCEVCRPADGTDGSGVSAEHSASADKKLVDRIRGYLLKRVGSLGGSVEIRFGQAGREALGLSEGRYEFRIHQRGGEALGLVSLEVDVIEDGKVVERVPVVAEVSADVPVVVARGCINRGAKIEAEAVMLESRHFERLDRIGLTDVSAAVGQEASRFIKRGEQLSSRDIRPLPLVKRGDVVMVVLRSKGIVVEAAGKALGTGCYGQMIEVRGPGSKESFGARVTGLRTVAVIGS